MTSIADGSVRIQTTSASNPSPPSWFGEVVAIPQTDDLPHSVAAWLPRPQARGSGHDADNGVTGAQFSIEASVYASSASMKYTVARLIMNTLERSMIVTTEKPIETGASASPLTREDIEQLRGTVESAAQLDLHLQNLQEIDLSYMDLQGADLRGINLCEANLQGANLSEADLDGADLSCAYLGNTEANHVKLRGAKLSYATLRELDLRGFNLAELDLQNADLNGTDLRGAVLRGANLQGADLSTVRLNGPELRGAILHRSAFRGVRGKYLDRTKGTWKQVASAQATLIGEYSSSFQDQEGKQIVSEREAYLFGEHALLVGFSPVKLRELFPQGFAFAQARHLFDTWLAQTGDDYNEQMREAMWIGFAHRVCDLYHENDSEA